MDIVTALFLSAGLTIFLFGLESIVFLPLTVVYEFRKRSFLNRHPTAYTPFVSVIIPAFNEVHTIAQSISSVLASAYPSFELIVVDDGSNDGTGRIASEFLGDSRMRYIRKSNGGKASALNAGIAMSRGEIIVYTDADSIFGVSTLGYLARWFTDPKIDAVCGDDTPFAPETPLQKLLTITTHIGTGFVRRACSVLNIMPIISGNCGAVRAEILRKAGGFTEVWGEDLDFTFKLHRLKAKIIYDPEALVYCHVPATFASLWSQCIRWLRSYLKISILHKDMMFNYRYAPFSLYLPINWFNVVAVPLLQAAMLVLLSVGLRYGLSEFNSIAEVLAYAGYFFFVGIAVYSILLDKTPAHLKYLPLYGWLILPYSYFLDAVVGRAIFEEFRRVSEVWNKIERRNRTTQDRRTQLIPRWIAPAGAFLAVTIISASVLVLTRDNLRAHLIHPSVHAIASVTLATHFDAWEKPEDATRSVFSRDRSGYVHAIAVGAGRFEWNYFRWQGHEETWSNHQKGSSSDLFDDAITSAHAHGRGIVAIVDFFAPEYIKKNPASSAVGSDGAHSDEQVCFTELTRGVYGEKMKEMITYLAKNYALDAISLTELDCRRYCYDDRCLQAFSGFSGRKGWPRTLLGSDVNKENHDLGAWRSEMMARYLSEIADSVHAYGRKLYVDVPIDYDHMDDEGLYHGLHYPRVLTVADAIIVWDYFYLEGRKPSTSEDVASYFITHYDPTRIIFSVGLWGKSIPVSPDEFSSALQHELLGGARRIWITPNHMLTDDHWRKLTDVLRLQ